MARTSNERLALGPRDLLVERFIELGVTWPGKLRDELKVLPVFLRQVDESLVVESLATVVRVAHEVPHAAAERERVRALVHGRASELGIRAAVGVGPVRVVRRVRLVLQVRGWELRPTVRGEPDAALAVLVGPLGARGRRVRLFRGAHESQRSS